MRREIEKHILWDQPSITRWNKSLPIKINVHTWRLYLDRLPTRCNLDSRGIDLHSFRCPVCDGDIETAQHLFIDCPIASGLWRMLRPALTLWFTPLLGLFGDTKTVFVLTQSILGKTRSEMMSKSSHMLGSCIGTGTLIQIGLYGSMILFLLVKTLCNFLASC
ncbi:RNA-directed DNA polymerase, eukaryota, reverse transcriptase zinc-binding domain protein [Tanacetum coccineum]